MRPIELRRARRNCVAWVGRGEGVSVKNAVYAAGTDMLVSQMQTFINDEAGGGCSASGCTADQFEWATDQAAAAYIAGGGTVPSEDIANFLLECAQEMGYEGIVPASISA